MFLRVYTSVHLYLQVYKKNSSLDKHCYSCFRNPPLVATWKGWTRICKKMDGLLICVFFKCYFYEILLPFLPEFDSDAFHQLQYHQHDAKTYFSCFASSASSGTARMFMKPCSNTTCDVREKKTQVWIEKPCGRWQTPSWRRISRLRSHSQMLCRRHQALEI